MAKLKIFFFMVLVVCGGLMSSHAQTNAVPDAVELAVLKNIYDSLGGIGWTEATNWPTAVNWPATATSAQFGSWFGITVSNGDITKVTLNNNNLSGQIPSTISRLSKVSFIYLQRNSIIGTIPPSLGTMTTVVNLLLDNNQLSGEIPSSLGGMSALTKITLNNNSLIGNLPDSFSNLKQLNNLNLAYNQLAGPFPSSISGCTALVVLVGTSNKFTSLPVSLLILPLLNSVQFNINEIAAIPDFASHPNKAALSLQLNNNKLDFSQIESLFNKGIQSVTYSSQKNPDDVTYVKVTPGSQLLIPARNAGVNGSYAWERRLNGSSSWVNVNSLNEDNTQKTFRLSNYQQAGVGEYRYKMTNSLFAGVTIQSVSIRVNSGLDVVWNGQSGVINSNEILTKTVSDGWGNAGAISENVLTASTDGWFEFVINAANSTSNFLAGFSVSGNNAFALTDVNYGVEISSIGGLKLLVHESSATGIDLGACAIGDVIRIGRVGSLMKYYKNGVEIRSVSASASQVLQVKTEISKGSAAISITSFWIPASRGVIPDAWEYTALKAIYDSLGGALWTNKTNWPTGVNGSVNITAAQMDTWNGIDIAGGDITGLNLLTNNLKGKIPSAIDKLKKLKVIDFRINKITGKIPSTISALTDLTNLRLSDNQLSGNIPESIGALVNVTELMLAKNLFTGTLPSSIGYLTKLKWLSLYLNAQLTGPLPSTLYQLVNLTDLYIYDTGIDGPLAEEIGQLKQLKIFYGYRNKWSGSLPAGLGDIPALEKLYLYSNAFTGEVPENWRHMSNVKDLWFHFNGISGNLPEWISELSNLQTLSAGDTDMTGVIHPSYGTLYNLTGLYLQKLDLRGGIPDELQNLNKLAIIDVKFSHLEGPIPAWLMNKPTLKTFTLNDNNFTSLPDFSARTDKSSLVINLENNKIPVQEIERYFTGPGATPFSAFTYGPQKSTAPDPVQETPLNSTLRIEAPSGGTHGVYLWEKQVNGVWTSVNHLNESSQGNVFTITSMTAQGAGNYRYKVTNSWMPAFLIEGGAILMNLTDPVNSPATYRIDALYNGMITSARWRTAKPYAASGDGLKGMYLYEYDDQYQLKQAQWATPDFTLNTFTLAANQYRVMDLNYDPNGNIQSLKRYDGEGVRVHDFTYHYNSNATSSTQRTNQLNAIPGYASYTYNAQGQMIGEDKVDGDDQYVDYDVTGKVIRVFSSAEKIASQLKVSYGYDDRGFRLFKRNYETNRTTWYIRDVNDNVLSVLEEDNVTNSLNETEIPIYGNGKLGTYYPQAGQEGSTAYELTDNMGNVRALVKEKNNVYTATMEDSQMADISNQRVEELQYFQNLFETEVTDFRLNHTSPLPGQVLTPDKSAYLYWNDTPGTQAIDKAIGPAIALRVEAGDELTMETFARYEHNPNITHDLDLTLLASLLGNTFVGTLSVDNLPTITNMMQNGLSAGGFVGNGTDNSRPYAFLNYMLFDENNQFVDGGAWRVTTGAAFLPGEETAPGRVHEKVTFSSPLNIEQKGSIYIWVSNESKQTKVWFDDLKVTHKQGIVTQATDYYPHGSVAREVKTPDELLYRYGYQGQFAEKDEETGWSHFELREYDPVIGRWTTIDPASQHYSPYLALGNDPINRLDPDGSWDGYQTPTNGFQRLWNNMIGKQFLNDAYDFFKDTPDGFDIKSAAYFEDAVSFVVDAKDPEGNTRFANTTYTFRGDKVIIGIAEMFDPQDPYGVTEDPNMKLAGPKMTGWITKSVFKKLGKNDKLLSNFVSAIKNGIVESKGKEGIKILKGKGIKGTDNIWYQYELKILDEGAQHHRILGNLEKWINQKGVTKDIIIFRNWTNRP